MNKDKFILIQSAAFTRRVLLTCPFLCSDKELSHPISKSSISTVISFHPDGMDCSMRFQFSEPFLNIVETISLRTLWCFLFLLYIHSLTKGLWESRQWEVLECVCVWGVVPCGRHKGTVYVMHTQLSLFKVWGVLLSLVASIYFQISWLYLFAFSGNYVVTYWKWCALGFPVSSKIMMAALFLRISATSHPSTRTANKTTCL